MKDFLKYFIALAILIAIFQSWSFGQLPCSPDTKSYYHIVPVLENRPPLNTGMPLETLIGYIATDSICKSVSTMDMIDFMKNQSYNDTVKYASKFYYWMVDYDPITFCQYSHVSPLNQIRPFDIETSLIRSVRRETHNRAIELVIASSYILHVAINDTIIVYKYDDTANRIAEHDERPSITIVSSTIFDTLKGRVIPTISSNPQSIAHKNQNIEKFQSTGQEFIFNFSNFWLRYNSIPLNDGQGNAWLQPGSEYILFLGTVALCVDEEYFYFTIFPQANYTTSFGMYRIIDGNVFDIGNDFGMGEYVPVQQFKQQINNVINGIKFYGE